MARLVTEVLNSSREMFAVSLRTPRNSAELSKAREEVPGAEKVPSRLLLLSNAEIEAMKFKVSSTAIWVPAPLTGVSKLSVSGPGFPGAGN